MGSFLERWSVVRGTARSHGEGVTRFGAKRIGISRRTLLATPLLITLSLGALWVGIHRITWLGPMLADGARALVGPKPIAWIEDRAYAIQDRYNRWRYKDTPPVSYWEAPASGSVGPASGQVPTIAIQNKGALDSDFFPPPNFKPPHPNVAAAGDGMWIPIVDPQHPEATPGLYKVLVHPDPRRSYAVTAVVAMDLRKIELFAVPGSREPQSDVLPREHRPGRISEQHYPDLLAAFNGGFQAVHGHWGMMVDGVTLLPPRPNGCTVIKYKDESMRIAAWKKIADKEEELSFFRQTPPCLLEAGGMNPAAKAEENVSWGATVEGETIIRRSALGLDKTRRVVFYAMGDSLSAGTLAKGMASAGAWDVAQLDVNFAYPRFFVFDGAKEGKPKVDKPLAPLKGWKPGQYVDDPEYRDFFYVIRRRIAQSG